MSRRLNETEVLWLALVPASVLTLGAVAAAATIWTRRESRKTRTLVSNLTHLMHHLHNYALAHDENFPVRISKLIDDGHVPWFPDNPFTGGPMPQIVPGGQRIPGGFSYLPWREKTSGEIVAATLIGYGRSPRLRRVSLPPLPELPLDLPWGYCQYAETTGFLPESTDDLELAT